MEEIKAKFNKNDLVIINVFGEGDDWANEFYDLAQSYLIEAGNNDPLSAPDFDGEDGISVLIPLDDFPCWEKAGKELGFVVEKSTLDVEPGRYGDSNWSGVVIAHDGDNFWWIEL